MTARFRHDSLMKARIHPFFALCSVAWLLLGSLPGAQAAEEPRITDGLAASVNGEPILVSDVVRRVRPALERVRREEPNLSDDAVFRKAFAETLRDLENQRLVIQEYWRGEMRLPGHAIDKMAAEVLDDRYGGDLQQLQADLAQERLTYTEWKEQLEERLIISSMRHTFVDGNVHVSPNEVRRAYEQNRERFAEGLRIHVFLATIPMTETNDIAAFREALAQGEAFADAARRFSRDASAAKGGDFGMLDVDAMLIPELAVPLKQLSDGEISGPIQLSGSVYFLYRKASIPARILTISEVWDELESVLLNERRAERFRQWVENLRATAAIQEFSPFEEH